jgi:hypothetical protein
MIVMKDGSDLQKILNSVLAEMQELEQENMDKEDENARLLQQLLVAREDGMEIAEHNAVLRKKLTEKHDDNADVTKAVDAERKRSWNENKAFQWDLAEQNAEMRKQLTEKHNDNARLQGQLAQAHNKLKVALQLQPQTDYKEIVDKVNILWEERYDS